MQVATASANGVEDVVDEAAQPVRLSIDQIARIERREFDGARTVLLVAAMAAGVCVVYKPIEAAAVAALASNIQAVPKARRQHVRDVTHVTHRRTPGRTRPGAAINGFSDLSLELFGPQTATHRRSAVGLAGLPFDIPV